MVNLSVIPFMFIILDESNLLVNGIDVTFKIEMSAWVSTRKFRLLLLKLGVRMTKLLYLGEIEYIILVLSKILVPQLPAGDN